MNASVLFQTKLPIPALMIPRFAVAAPTAAVFVFAGIALAGTVAFRTGGILTGQPVFAFAVTKAAFLRAVALGASAAVSTH